MKKIASLLILSAAAMTALTSCNSRARLAESIQGQWTGNPERLLDTGAATASAVRVMEFTAGSTDTEGTVTLSALITVENTMPFNDSIQTPLTITATGSATVTGVYQAKDDDELLISLDATSLATNTTSSLRNRARQSISCAPLPLCWLASRSPAPHRPSSPTSVRSTTSMSTAIS